MLLCFLGCDPAVDHIYQCLAAAAQKDVYKRQGAAVDDDRVVTLFQHKIQQLLRLLAGQGAPGLKIEVGPVKAGGHLVGLLQDVYKRQVNNSPFYCRTLLLHLCKWTVHQA